MKTGTRLYILSALAILAASLALRGLTHAGLLDGATGTRSVMVTIGIIVLVFGNRVPKSLLPPRATPAAERRTQAALRSTGWVMTSAGLVFAAAWLLAPERIAQPLSLAAVGLAFVYTLYRIVRCKQGAEERSATL